MAEGNPTEFLIENTEDKKFIGEFINFMRDNKSQYHITDYEVNKLSSHLDEGANIYEDGYFGVTINMNLAQYTAKDTFSFDFIGVDDLTKDSRLFNNKVKKFMNSINGDKLDTVPSSPKKKGGKRRKKKTRKKRGGLDSFPIGMLDQLSQDTVYNHPQKDDLIRRLNHIWNILGEDEEDQEAFKDLIRRNPNSFYQLINHFIQQAEAEHHGGRRKKKKTRKKRGGELKDLSVEKLKAALDRSLSFHIHLFSQLVDASGEFNYKFRHPNWEPGEPSVEEQLFGKYEDWRYDKMMEHKGIAADYGDEMGQYIANAPIDELNGTMDFYCKNWKSALGERLKNSILNFKKLNKEKIQEINFEHFFEWEKLVKKSKSLEKLYLEFIDRIKEIYEVYKEKKKMKDVEERNKKKETDDEEYGTFDAGADIDDPDYDEALDQYRKYYKGEDIKPMMKAYFDNNGFGWDGVAPNEILGHNDYKKPLIDITKHTKDNIEEEFNYHYFDGEWVEITTEESIKPIVWVIENTQNSINRFASSELPEDRNGLDEMLKTMRDGEMTGGFWIVEWNKEREKDDRYNHFHLAWSDYDTEPFNVLRFVEQHGPLHSASESESTDLESLGSNPEGPIGGQGPTSGGERRRKKKTRKKKNKKRRTKKKSRKR